jgi:hypothetical protein
MLIEAIKAHKANKWEFNLNNTMYTFTPDRQGRMVAEVSDPYHITLLLERDKSFREVVRNKVTVRRKRENPDGHADVLAPST